MIVLSWADYGRTHAVDVERRADTIATHMAAFRARTLCGRQPRRVSGAATYPAGTRPDCEQCLHVLVTTTNAA